MRSKTQHESNPATGAAAEPPGTWRTPDRHLQALLCAPWYRTLLSLVDTVVHASHGFFRSEGAIAAATPVTTASISSPMGPGSDSIPVQADIAGRPVYLADSMQFALELALRVAGRPAYYIMPSFRGERSDDRHLNQFIHAEAEIEGGLEDVIRLVERYVGALSRALLTECADRIEPRHGSLEHLEAVAGGRDGFAQMTFAEARQRLDAVTDAFQICASGDPRITASGERALIGMVGGPVWITRMPASTVPFYQARDPNDPTVSLTADLLMGIGETVGAGERAPTKAALTANLKASSIAGANYLWYLDMKEQVPVRTAGFGLGVERFLLWALNMNDIRDMAWLVRNEFGEGAP